MPPVSALPAGTRFAFERDGRILTATYPNLRTAVVVGQGQDPSLSPDGKQVAFEESSRGGERSFCVRDTATGRLIRRHAGTIPHFSPDGKHIAFSLFSGTRWILQVADAALALPRTLTGGTKDSPAFVSGWTRDGLLIAYSEQLGGGIYALHADGTVVRKALISEIAGGRNTSIPFGCAWSDDLSRIAFEAETGDELAGNGQPLYGLFLYDFATKKRRLLTPKGEISSNPLWAGRDLLLFTSGRNTKHGAPSQIRAMEVSIGTLHSVIPNAAGVAIARRGI